MEYQKFIPEGWKDTNEIYTNAIIKNAFETGQIMQGKVTSCDTNYNLHIHLGNGIEGIIPRNEIDAIKKDEYGLTEPKICKNKVNTMVQFKVKERYSDNQILLSRKQVGEEALNWVKNELEPGIVVKGIIKNIRKFGVFVEIGGGMVGLLHIEDISISRIKTPEERFSIGQKIDVMIKSIDKQTGKIILSYKELLGDWYENIKEYKEKMIVTGTVKETDKYKNGIFIELKPNLVGMAEYKEGFYYGQKVNVFIKKIIEAKQKIKLIII